MTVKELALEGSLNGSATVLQLERGEEREGRGRGKGGRGREREGEGGEREGRGRGWCVSTTVNLNNA